MNRASEVRNPDHNLDSRTWIVYLVLGVAAMGAYFALSGVIKDVLYNLIGVSTVIALWVGVRRYRPDRTPSWYIIIGLALYVAGDVLFFNIYENVLDIPRPFPSVADALYLSSYPVVAIGLTLLVRRAGRRARGGLIDAAIIAAGLGLLSWEFLVEPYAEDQSALLFAMPLLR